MKFPLFLLTILNMRALFTPPQLKDQTLIETTCRSTSNYDLCISTLQSNPNSATADVAGLGLIVVDAVKAKTEKALSVIEELKWLHPEMGGALAECGNAYRAVLKADIPEAMTALRLGVPKFAEFGMSDTVVEAEICERSFDGVGGSPLSGVNKDVSDLAEVATNIIKNLL